MTSKERPSAEHERHDLPGPSGMLKTPLPALHDLEGESVPAGLPPIVDAHVHIFPDALFASIREWFKKFGWPIRYRLEASEVVEFLLSRGIGHVVALQYAHKPGVARELNAFMAALSASHSRVTGLATVFPGEEDAPAILREAFQQGLSGVKLHSHVQCFNMESDVMNEVYQVCEENRKPLVVHAGREPKSPAYHCDPYVLCSAEKLERVLRDHPGLRVCVPHLGADEFSAYAELIEKYDTLWLDTTMMMADYLPHTPTMPLRALRPDRVMYGTDFPNIPYAWDRELKRFCELGLPEETASLILGKNAMEFFGISAPRTNERGS